MSIVLVEICRMSPELRHEPIDSSPLMLRWKECLCFLFPLNEIPNATYFFGWSPWISYGIQILPRSISAVQGAVISEIFEIHSALAFLFKPLKGSYTDRFVILSSRP
jgi:hypothetical protein